jgi:hypothetical protein
MEFSRLNIKDKFDQDDEERSKVKVNSDIRSKEDFELYYEKDLGVINLFIFSS